MTDGDCAALARIRRNSDRAAFDEALRNVIAFVRADAEAGTRSPRTTDAVKQLRRLYHEATEA